MANVCYKPTIESTFTLGVCEFFNAFEVHNVIQIKTIVCNRNEGNFDVFMAETKTTDRQTDNRLQKTIRKKRNRTEEVVT